MAKTARRQVGGPHLLFGEYLWSWTNLTFTIEDEYNIDAGKHVLAMFGAAFFDQVSYLVKSLLKNYYYCSFKIFRRF